MINFSFKMFKIMRSLRSSKCLKTTVELMFTTQKGKVCSSWNACYVFNWQYFFGYIWSKNSKLSVLS